MQRSRLPPQRRWCERASTLAIAATLLGTGCSRKYTEIEVRDAGRVGVGLLSTRGVEPALPPDGSQRVVALAGVPGAALMRRGREVALGWGERPPVILVDEHGVLPRVPPGSGIEVRGHTLWATYNVTATRVFPQKVQPEDALPVVISTDMSNVVDAREVKEVRHWPAYVCLPVGALFTVAGMLLLSSDNTGEKVGGGVYLAAAVPLLVYSVLNLTSSNEIKPLDLPGNPPR